MTDESQNETSLSSKNVSCCVNKQTKCVPKKKKKTKW